MFDEIGPHLHSSQTAPAARTVGEMFWLRAARSASNAALFHKEGGAWRKVTWAGFKERASKVAKGLLALGLHAGDRVGILGPTQPPWAYYDIGAQLSGMVSFGIYPKQSPSQIRYLLEHSEAKILFVDEEEELESVLAAAEGLRSLAHIVPWTEALFEAFRGRDPRLLSPSRFAEEGLSDREIQAIQAAIDPEATAIFIYTSGTTGPPKGAMISHRNITALLSAYDDAFDYYQDDLSIHFLPMAHAAERVMGFYARISVGIAGAYAQGMGTVLEDVQVVRPTLFGSVPRIFEKAYAKIHSEIGKQSPAVKRLFAWADRTGREVARRRIEGRPVPPALALRAAIADRLVFRKIRQAFGGRVRIMLTGAAPTAPEILEFFWGAGLPVFEVYGMTEATVLTHANRFGSVRLGTVGRPVPGLEQRLAEDGEVLMRAPWVFKGYYKNEEATAQAVQGGWLHSGDIGKIDEDGFLRITDRKKHLIITAGGKNLAPANIEKAIKTQDPLISQVHAHGDGRPYVSAILAPSAIETLELGVEHGLLTQAELETRTAELMANPSGRSAALNTAMAKVVALPIVKERMRAAVKRGNQDLARVEQVRRFVILDRDFSQEEGELTPTMKLKRKEIEGKFKETFDRIYEDSSFALEPG